METQPMLIDGAKVNLGGKEYIIPPLSLGALRRLMPKIESITKNVDFKNLDDQVVDNIAEIISTAMQRNYPDMTKEAVLDLIDMRNMSSVIGAVLGMSGFEKQQGGQQPGEAETSQSIST